MHRLVCVFVFFFAISCGEDGPDGSRDSQAGTTQEADGGPDTCTAGDADGDATCDDADECPMDSGKTEEGICGCGVADTDSDADGTADCDDACPMDAAKTEEGICGCGIADADSDTDGLIDCDDACPMDSAKTEEGICGCGVADTDQDADGTVDCEDACPMDPVRTEEGACGCGQPEIDSDSDGVFDCNDPCPRDNPDDTDMDGICDSDDVCDGDDASGDGDQDGICDDIDTCLTGLDRDGDSVCDDVDDCLGTPIFSEDFEGTSHAFALNTSDLNSKVGTFGVNYWVVNSRYVGGRELVFECASQNYVTAYDTPDQPSEITNSPTSRYLHITNTNLASRGISNATFRAPNQFCSSYEYNFAKMTRDIITTDMTAVSLSFWWFGGGTSRNHGEVYYSTDFGNSWTLLTSPTAKFYRQGMWTQALIQDPNLTGHSWIRFAFRFVNPTASGYNNRGFSIDEVKVCGASGAP